MNSTKSETLPQDVHIQFIRSLYDNVYVILVGAGCHAAAALMSYWTSGAPIYLWFAGILALLGTWRFVSMLLVVRRGEITDYATAERCERAYIVQGSLQGLALGSFCFTALYLVPDAFAELAALAVTLSSLVTVSGRNYGSRAMVAIFAVTIVLPIAIGLILRWDGPSVLLGLLIIPFFFVIKRTADHIRYVLYSAVLGHRQARKLAQRFDRALNTMSQGLVMVDADNLVVVANSQAAAMLGIPSQDRMIGRSFSGLLRRGVAAKLMSHGDCTRLEAQLHGVVRDRRDRKLLLKLADGRHIEFSARDGQNDLDVITFEDVTSRIAAEERIRFMARYDSLTGLPNRAFFHELVADRMARGGPDYLAALVIVDIDDFKSVNDTLGHPVGDGLLAKVADRLKYLAGEKISISRFGGDEFVLFVDHIGSEARLVVLLEDIFRRLAGDVDISGHLLPIQVSAGAVVVRADTDVDSMFVKADLALYKAKHRGKRCWTIFEPAMDDAFRHRQILKADLRNAINENRLRVIYQPIVCIKSMRISGCEALTRWEHPKLGMISPSIFIPLAEEMGIISDLSIFVLSTACQECAKWPAPMSVSVNFSAKDFRSGTIVGRVKRALEYSGLDPWRLEIEVTETALLEDLVVSKANIDALKDLGVRIALDDFGTGYSSLSYLHTLPFDKIKIDRSFIQDLCRNERALTLLKGIVTLSRSLGLLVTIEGVETLDQLRVLEDRVGPDLLQGFLFGSELSAGDRKVIAEKIYPFKRPREPLARG